MIGTVRIEVRKLLKSRIGATATTLLSLALPGMGLAMYSVATGAGGGPLADKARIFLTHDGWEGYVDTVAQISAVAMFLGAGVVVAWAFGREHTDRTFSSLFALPTSRSEIATAKLTTLSAWGMTVTVGVVVLTALLGVAAGVGDWSAALDGRYVLELATVCVAAFVLALPIAWVASIGRGPLPAITAVIVLIAIGQVVVVIGSGGWFPFAIPGLIAAAGAPGVPEVGGGQFAVMLVTVAAGVAATLWWWAHAEVN